MNTPKAGVNNSSRVERDNGVNQLNKRSVRAHSSASKVQNPARATPKGPSLFVEDSDGSDGSDDSDDSDELPDCNELLLDQMLAISMQSQNRHDRDRSTTVRPSDRPVSVPDHASRPCRMNQPSSDTADKEASGRSKEPNTTKSNAVTVSNSYNSMVIMHP